MTLTVELTSEQADCLARAAASLGITPEQLGAQLIVDHLPVPLAPDEVSRREKVMRQLISESEQVGLYR